MACVRAYLYAALLCASVAYCGTVTYTDRNAFVAATSALSTVTFDGIADEDTFVAYDSDPLTVGDITFRATDGALFVIGGRYFGSEYSSAYLTSSYSDPDTLIITGPSATALGFDVGGLYGAPITFSVQLTNGEVMTFESKRSIQTDLALQFFGLTSTVPFTSVVFKGADQPFYTALDNYTVGTAGQVPEPLTGGIVGAGIAFLFARRRIVQRHNSIKH